MAAASTPDFLDDRYQTRLPKIDASPDPSDLDMPPGFGGGGGGSDGSESERSGGGGSSEPSDGSGGGGGAAGGTSGDVEYGPPGEGEGYWSRLRRMVQSRRPPPRRLGRGDMTIFFPDELDVRAYPLEGDRRWQADGSCSVYRDGEWLIEPRGITRGDPSLEFDPNDGSWRVRDPDSGEWSDWQPPAEGQIQRDGDSWRRWEGGSWSEWSLPSDGAVERRADGWSRVWRQDAWRSGEWSDWRPPLEGESEWRDDGSYRRFRGGEWSEWRGPSDGDIEWSDGEWREYRGGEWGEWQAPREGDVEYRADEQRAFRDGAWEPWEARPDLDDSRRRELFGEEYQQELPSEREPRRDEDEDEEVEEEEEPAEAPPQSPAACNCGGVNFGGQLGTVGQVLLWTLLGVSLVVIAALIFRHWKRRRTDDDEEDEDEDDLDEELEEEEEDDSLAAQMLHEALSAPLADYDQLAAAKRWDEAIHTLFLHTLRALIQRSDRRIKASVTSRELTDMLGLDEAGHESFGVLVRTVERSRFALVESTESDWTHFRARALALAPGASTAPSEPTAEAA